MRTAFICFVLVASLCNVVRPEEENGPRVQQQRPAPLGGLISGLLGSLTQTAEVSDCPGKCIHALASLICDEVREDVVCPGKSLRCCVERDQRDNENKRKEQMGSIKSTSPTTTTTTTTTKTTTTSRSTTTTTTRVKVAPIAVSRPQPRPEVRTTISRLDSVNKVGEASSSSDNDPKGCPGVCVADRLSGYCEAILQTEGLCKSSLKCCVSKQAFDTSQLTIPKKPSATTTTTTKKPKSSSKECKGTCVAGFFALLCDEIDQEAHCPQNGRCCLSRRGSSGGNKKKKRPEVKCPGVCIPQVMASVCTEIKGTTSCAKGTVCCQSKENKKPSSSNNNKNTNNKDSTNNKGPNLGQVFSSLLSAATGSNTKTGGTSGSGAAALLPILAPAIGSFLGGSKPSPSSPSPSSSSSLATSLLPMLGTFLGGGGGGSRPPPRRPASRRPRPTLVPTTTTTTTTTEKPDDRPECPGTCIASYLSFTCFGNAALTDVFKCDKESKQCCSPKTDISKRKAEIKRNELRRHYSVSNNNNNNRHSLDQRPQDSQLGSIYIPPGTNHNNNFRPTAGPAPSAGPAPAAGPADSSHVTNKYVCGVKGDQRRQGRVVGGEDGLPGEWCWQVALINALNQYLCGGALIGTQWVLTAAHCVTNIVRAGDAIYVRVGDHDLTQKFGSPGAQTLRVATTYIHHNHNSQTLDNDIALLKLHGEAELEDGTCLVCLPARGTSQQAGKICTVTGYGYMGETGPIPLRVREAPVPVVNDNECVRKINAVTEKIFILPASSFCAGGTQGNDACQGDGGGPLVCEDNGYYELTGLVSWGFGCGRQDVPGVYVKISSFIGWINQIISVNNL